MTIPYAEVIGDPIAQSKSPVIHKHWLAALGIDADYRAVHVTAAGLSDYFAARRLDPAWRGCNVTMPHKQAVMAHCDVIGPLASRIGAINTVVRGVDGTLTGHNTDVDGVAEPLRKMRIATYASHVATYAYVIGAGGAARAAIEGVRLSQAASDTEVFNRTITKAHALAVLAGNAWGEAQPLGNLTPIRRVDNDEGGEQKYSHIIINATSMGMLGNPPVPIDLSRYYPDTIVFDMVYAPLETPLLAQARARGLRTIDGLSMLIGQASAAFTRFFGEEPPRGDGDGALRAILAN